MKRKQIEALQRLYQKIPKSNCQGLCSGSCGPVYMERGEFVNITRLVGSMPPLQDEVTCGLLKDERCTVYSRRPVICRLFGSAENLPCPFGCTPDRMLNEAEALEIRQEVVRLAGDGHIYGNFDWNTVVDDLKSYLETTTGEEVSLPA